MRWLCNMKGSELPSSLTRRLASFFRGSEQISTSFGNQNHHIPGTSSLRDRVLNRHVYDITHGQFLRLLLLAESPTRHHLIVGYHHINMDGMSMLALTEHIRLAYRGQLLPPPFQQNEFSTRQRERLEAGQHTEDILFWKNEFEDLPEILPILPMSPNTTVRSSRPIIRTTYRHVRAETRLKPAITTKLLELRKQGHLQSPSSCTSPSSKSSSVDWPKQMMCASVLPVQTGRMMQNLWTASVSS